MAETKKKMTKDIVPEDFTMGLALVDLVPVVFFGLSFILLGSRLGNWLFMAGAIACLVAGAVKVLWKIIVVLKHKNIWWMFVQMRILMPAGFLMMLVGFCMCIPNIDAAGVWAAIIAFPAVIFFVLGLIGMIMMGVFGAVLDSSDLRSNWIEQSTNGIAQICIFTGILISIL